METFAKSGKKEVKMASNKFIWPIADLKHCTFGRLELCYSDSCKYEEKCRILSSNVNIQKPRLDNMKSHYKHGKHIVVESRPLNIMQVWLELKIRRMALLSEFNFRKKYNSKFKNSESKISEFLKTREKLKLRKFTQFFITNS